MPYEEHEGLTTPPSGTVLWRYLSFVQFVQLLETNTLWFARADQFEDPLEATYTDADLVHLRSLDPEEYFVLHRVPVDQAIKERTASIRGSVYASCWREGRPESMAMWELYGKGVGTVAVKTTVGRLKVEMNKQSVLVQIARVRYISWSDLSWPTDALKTCIRKDTSYAYEAEVRLLIDEQHVFNSFHLASFCGSAKSAHLRTANDPPFGLKISVDVSKMVTEVVVGPKEPVWIASLVESLLARYGLTIPITISDRLKPRS